MIFDGMTKQLGAKKKFIMYPRFLQLFLQSKLANTPVPEQNFPYTHINGKSLKFLEKNGKGFSGTITALFPNMLVDQVDPAEGDSEVSDAPTSHAEVRSPTPFSDQVQQPPITDLNEGQSSA